MNQPVAVSDEIHEGAEIDDLHNFSAVDQAYFGLRHNVFDPLDCGFARLVVGRRNLNRAIIADIDLSPGGFADLTNDLAAGTDDLTYLVFRYLDRSDPWRMLVH